MIRNRQQSFEPTIPEALTDPISLFPLSCFVELNTGTVNPRLPLRPHIEFRFNRSGNETPARLVNLRNQPTLMVCSCMHEEFAREQNR